MKTNIEKRNGEYTVTFTHGVQTFTLDYQGTKEECEWYKDRLDACFARAFGEVINDFLEWQQTKYSKPYNTSIEEQIKDYKAHYNK